MAMTLSNPEAWISALLENIPEDKLASSLKDDNPDWEYIDGEIVKLGSLTHSQLDIPEIQRRGLAILASESKDFRLLAHLLRTLQHSGNILLALRLLEQYVGHYWLTAAPQNMAHKQRFAAQVLKRFEAGVSGFAENVDLAQRADALQELEKLTQGWLSHNAPALAQATKELSHQFERAFAASSPAQAGPAAVGQTASVLAQTALSNPSTTVQPYVPAPKVTLDTHDDKAWRDTLLNVAAILCERQPEMPQGYCLRRLAVWQTITSAPLAESDGRTPLAAVPADMAADYQASAASADLALWQQVEKSLLLAPYWLDGQHLSARIALKLGFDAVSQAIHDETLRFTQRLPALATLLFNDRTPFMNEQTSRWLAAKAAGEAGPSEPADDVLEAAKARFEEQGLEAALRYLDGQPAGEPRDRFYRQFLGAQLMAEAGLEQSARQQYQSLFRLGQQTTLADWEPSLLARLEKMFMAER